MGAMVQAFSAVLAGNAQGDQYDVEAGNKLAEARAAEINGLRTNNDKTDSLLDVLARQRNALATGSVGFAAGAVKQIFGGTLDRGDASRKQSDVDAAISARAARVSSRGLLAAGAGARMSGWVKADETLTNAALRAKGRG